jgi:hypothetical protein
MQMVEEQAPGGFKRLGDVLTQREREEEAPPYAVLPGPDRDSITRADCSRLAEVGED